METIGSEQVLEAGTSTNADAAAFVVGRWREQVGALADREPDPSALRYAKLGVAAPLMPMWSGRGAAFETLARAVRRGVDPHGLTTDAVHGLAEATGPQVSAIARSCVQRQLVTVVGSPPARVGPWIHRVP